MLATATQAVTTKNQINEDCENYNRHDISRQSTQESRAYSKIKSLPLLLRASAPVVRSPKIGRDDAIFHSGSVLQVKASAPHKRRKRAKHLALLVTVCDHVETRTHGWYDRQTDRHTHAGDFVRFVGFVHELRHFQASGSLKE